MSDDDATSEVQAAGIDCPHCPSPPECRCPDTPAVCRTGGCECGPECPCPEKPEPPWWDPCRRRRWRRAHSVDAGGAGWGGRGFGCLGVAVLGLILLGLGLVLWLFVRSDGDSTNENTEGRSTTSTSVVDDGPTDRPDVPSPLTAILAVLADAGITGADADTVTDAVGPVEGVLTGPGTNVVDPRPGFLDPILDGSANVTLPSGNYRVFVTQTGGPLDPSVQWGIAVAREGAPLSVPSGSDSDYYAQFPSSAGYIFDTVPGTGPVERLDPVAGYTPVPTTALYYVRDDSVAVLIPIDELAPGGTYATQIFLRVTPPGATPTEADPTAWTAWVDTGYLT